MTSQKFTFFSDEVVTYCADFEKVDISTHTLSRLKVELDDLERRWRQFVLIYETNMTSSDPQITKDIQELMSEKFSDTLKSYKTCKASILDLMEIVQVKMDTPRKKSTVQTKVENVKIVEDTGGSLKVPPCDTEMFSGGYDKWPSFRDMFTAIYVNHPKLSPAQKLFHLRGKTRGEANQIVKQFALTDDNFILAWDALKQRYENQRILINHQLRRIFEMDSVNSERGKSLRNLQYTINNALSVLKTYNISVISWDPFLVFWVSSKLPDETLSAWENSIIDHKQMPSWSQLDEFISKRLNMIESLSDMRKPSNSQPSSNKSQNFYAANESNFRPCKACKKNHALRFCPKFKSWPLSRKQNFVSTNNICENCLSYGHLIQDCQSEYVCQKCQQKHHSTLHPDSNNTGNRSGNSRTAYQRAAGSQGNQSYQAGSFHVDAQSDEHAATSDEPPHSTTYNVQSHFADSGEGTVLPTALAELEHLGTLFTVRIFIDQGSQESFISNRIVNKFSIPTTKSFTRISGLGGTILENSSRMCYITLKSRKSNFKIRTSALVVSNLKNLMPSAPTQLTNWSGFNEIDLADPHFFRPGPIDMLLGSDVFPSIIKVGIQRNVFGSLLAQESEFGWLISGPPRPRNITTFSSFVAYDDSINDDIRKFWELEEVPKSKPQSENDSWCENFFQNTTKRMPNGRYMVRLPFRQLLPPDFALGSSRPAAMGQFLRMEKTLEKSPELGAEYSRVLSEYLTLDHMELAPPNEIVEDCCYRSFYLPHHAVIRPESSSTKVRVVFNASKKTSTGISLNDILHTGPTLQNDLINVILRWRFFKFVFNGDIEKMYRQIYVHEIDRPFQKTLFREFRTEPIQDFYLKTVTFGVNCAPYLAIRTLLQLSEDGKATHPVAASILKNQIYVDDILSGGHTIQETQSYLRELIDLLSTAGFPLKKLTANHSSILQDLPSEDLLDEDVAVLKKS
ncbi:uncharacterized protein LOC142231438 [Haematobia irritans]|uniref:uncharacterized protein LOC142231438 n=1 Tax=Haematobia irritans TaxID=7368 RepID=UPI003F506F8F